MKTAVIYARYSCDKQGEQSIEGQLRVCNDYAARNEIVVLDTYIDRAMTGKNDKRVAFQKMLKDCTRKSWDIVLVYKLDRFCRNKYEAAIHKKTLRDNGVKLISAMENIPDTPEGIILESLLEGMAEYYSAELSQKVARGLNESRLKGLFTGGQIIYGYKVKDKKVYIDEDEAKIVKDIYEYYAAGIPANVISDELNNKGLLIHGKPFDKMAIYRILKNEKYSGVLIHGDKRFTNIYPQIVSDKLFNIVKTKINENKYGKHICEDKYILKNKIRCGYCGDTVASASGTSKTGKVSRYYKCNSKKHNSKNCKCEAIRKNILEDIVVQTTYKLFTNKDTLNYITEKITEHNKKLFVENTTLNLLIKQQYELKNNIDNILDCMAKGILTKSVKERLEKLEAEYALINEQIAREQNNKKVEITSADITKFIKTALKKSLEQVIKILINKIVLYNDKIEIYYNYTNLKESPDNDGQDFLFYSENYKEVIKAYLFKKEDTEFVIKIDCFIKL